MNIYRSILHRSVLTIASIHLVMTGSYPVYAASDSGQPVEMSGSLNIFLIFLGLLAVAAILHRFGASRRLEETRKRYEALAAQLSTAQSITHIGSWDQDIETDHINWSDETYRIFGYKRGPGQLTGKYFIDGVHPDDRKRVLTVWSDGVKNGTGYTVEHRVVQPGGTIRHVREIAEIQLGRDGEAVGFVGTVQDITDEIRADGILRRNNRLLEMLGNVGMTASSSSSLQEALQFSIDEVCRATEWPVGHAFVRDETSEKQLLPTRLWNKSLDPSFAPFVKITEATRFEEGLGLPGRVLATGQPVWMNDVTADSNFPRADVAQETGLHGAFAFPVLSGGKVVAGLEFFNTVQVESDPYLLEILSKVGTQLGWVSERLEAEAAIRESESRFRNYAESASDWFWEVDADLRYSGFSGRNEEISGISSNKNIGHSRMEILQDILTDEEKQQVEKWADHYALLARRESFQDLRYSVNSPDGGIIHLRVNGIPVFADDGEFGGYRGTARDETSEVDARREEAAARALLLDAIESLDDGFALFDADDRLVLYNRAYHEMNEAAVPGALRIGDTFEQLLDKWAKGGVFEADGLALQELVQERLNQHQTLPSTSIHRLLDGNWIQVSERRTSDGGCVLLRHPVTELKQTEEALMDSEERMRRLIDIAPEAIIVTDQDLKIQIFNTGAERAFGYLADEVMGKQIEMLIPGRFQKMHSGYVQGFAESDVVKRPMSERTDIYGQRKNGEEFPAEAAISKLETPDGLVFTVMLRDISARVTAENELQRVRAHLEDAIETISQAVSLWDPENRLLLYNHEFKRLFRDVQDKIEPGLDFDDLVDLAHTHNVFSNDDGISADYMQKRIASFHRADGVPLNRMTVEGRHYQVVDVRTHDGGVLSVGSDITDVVTREQALQEAMRLAELANRAKSEFLANMSHELRTPLNAILGFSEILKTEPFGEMGDRRYAEYAFDIHDSGTHLLEIINDILDLSRIEAGQVTLRQEEVQVGEIVERVLTMLRGRATEGGVRIIDDLPDDLPGLYVDARILRQIMVNLVSNAVKFTDRDKEVRVTAGINAADEYFIIVRDEGIGISEDDIERVLEPFGQVDGSFTRTFEGVGLGLPLTKSFVEMHDGKLDLKSSPGEGTTVTVTFPADRVIKEV